MFSNGPAQANPTPSARGADRKMTASTEPNTAQPAQLVADVAGARKLKLLWVGCGDKDSLFNISEGVHKYLDEQNVPHVWQIDPGGVHDFVVWKNNLYHFSTRLFR